MAVTAQQMARAARGRVLDAVVHDQLVVIDDRLLRADRAWGSNCLAHELPTVFATIPGLAKKDIQRVVYSAVIRSLQDRGFSVRLRLESDKTTIFLEWQAGFASEDVRAMNRLIEDARAAPRKPLVDTVRGAPVPTPAARRQAPVRPLRRGGCGA